tara:strand:- start:129 stop:581 length:453 start_codon:yes stop_codon:yes gene_type:complete
MLKILILFLTVFTGITGYAGTFKVIGPCSEEPQFLEFFDLPEESNVGRVTVDLFERHSVPFVGTERGIARVFDSPTGDEALEVLNDSEMLAYGWCYSVNGIEPGVYADEYPVSSEDQITWWYGYAHYKEGEWIEQCAPSYERRSAYICGL